MRQLEGRPDLSGARQSAAAKSKPMDVYNPPSVPAASYNPAGDSALPDKSAKKDKKDKEKKKSKRDGDDDGGAEKKKVKKSKKDK